MHKAAQTDGGPGSSTGKTNYPAVFELGTFWPPKKNELIGVISSISRTPHSSRLAMYDITESKSPSSF